MSKTRLLKLIELYFTGGPEDFKRAVESLSHPDQNTVAMWLHELNKLAGEAVGVLDCRRKS